MWSFKIVLCNKDCDLKLCKDVNDYIKNADDCRGTAAVSYRSTTIILSMIPLSGINKLYSGNYFDAVFEGLEGVIALISICKCYCCCRYLDDVRKDDNHPLLACRACRSFLLILINVARYVISEVSTESLQLYEFSLMMTSIVIPLLFFCCGCVKKKCWFVSIILNLITVGLMEVTRDIYMATYSDSDGNGCPFV